EQQRCDDATAAADVLWRTYGDEIEAAMRSGGKAYAEANAARVRAGIEDWVARWGAARQADCEVDEPREQQRIQRCLEHQLDGFAAFLAIIDEQSGSPGIAAHAITAIATLPDPHACTDPRYDDGTGECGPELTLSLHRLRAMELAGLHEQGLEFTEALLADPGLRSCTGLETQALLISGRLGQQDPDTRDEGQARLLRALRQANAREDRGTARAAALALVSAEQRRGHIDVALVWLELAELYGTALGSQPAEVVEQELTRVELLHAAGRDDEARVALERVHGLLIDTLGEHHPAYLRYLKAAASFEVDVLHGEQARELLAQALTMAEDLYGPDHPETIGIMLLAVPVEPDGARRLALAEAALAKAEAAHGPDHLQTVFARERVGFALLLNGEHEPVRERYPAIIADYERLGASPTTLARALMHYGIACRRSRDLEGAEQALRRAQTLIEAELGSDHPMFSSTLINLANVVEELGRISEAVVLQRRALEILERRAGEDDDGIALILDNMGMLELELGDDAAAVA
ncbi:MAG: tetratricopeptide repeat protein, partial [Myxococcales bacterium]|nr:tetratricopeptide repeat protein [Myxococcales bacterium]